MRKREKFFGFRRILKAFVRKILRLEAYIMKNCSATLHVHIKDSIVFKDSPVVTNRTFFLRNKLSFNFKDFYCAIISLSQDHAS